VEENVNHMGTSLLKAYSGLPTTGKLGFATAKILCHLPKKGQSANILFADCF